VTKGLLSAEGFGSTKQLASAITLRWGAEVGGGHVQDSTGDTANSSYGEVKLMAGMEAQRGTLTGSLTYGLEIADPFSISTGIFEKHVFDGRFAWTHTALPQYVTSHGRAKDKRRDFIGVPHHPLTIEAQSNGGLLTGSAAVPSVERFLGGNQGRPFIPGQPWDALGQPFIRSIPENRLGAVTGTGVIGGDRFYSANLTVAKALWGKALLPRDLAMPVPPGETDFLNALDFGIATAKGELSDSYYSKDPNVSKVANTLGTLGDDLAALKAASQGPLTNLPSVTPLKRDLRGATSSVELIKKGRASVMPLLLNVQLPALVGDLNRLTNAARDAGDTASLTELERLKTELASQAVNLKTRWDKLDTSAARAGADAHAAADFAPAEGVLNKLLYTLNSFSIAPVAIFDVARLWPEQHGTRYAPGAGVRLSIVNANFTFGYAYNPIQANHEGSGAIFFKLDFTDLFR
jgi:hypothetical protein